MTRIDLSRDSLRVRVLRLREKRDGRFVIAVPAEFKINGRHPRDCAPSRDFSDAPAPRQSALLRDPNFMNYPCALTFISNETGATLNATLFSIYENNLLGREKNNRGKVPTWRCKKNTVIEKKFYGVLMQVTEFAALKWRFVRPSELIPSFFDFPIIKKINSRITWNHLPSTFFPSTFHSLANQAHKLIGCFSSRENARIPQSTFRRITLGWKLSFAPEYVALFFVNGIVASDFAGVGEFFVVEKVWGSLHSSNLCWYLGTILGTCEMWIYNVRF